jgi:hypothetical protein
MSGSYLHGLPGTQVSNKPGQVQTPAVAYQARPRATPGSDHPDTEFRVRRDRIQSARVSLRINGQCTTSDSVEPSTEPASSCSSTTQHIRVIHATTGEIIRTLTTDAKRR